MMNMSIECGVRNCKYHHGVEDYCIRHQIKIDTTCDKQSNTSDCMNFEKM